MTERKTISMKLMPQEIKFMEEARGDMKVSEFLREVFKSSTLIQNHARRTGQDVDLIFHARKRGGKRPGAGNPNWIKKKKD